MALTLQNTSSQAQDMGHSNDVSVAECDYKIHVETIDGAEADLLPRQKALRGLSTKPSVVIMICDSSDTMVAPGEQFIETVSLDKNFQLKKGVRYKFWATYVPDTNPPHPMEVRSNTIEFVR